MGSSSGAFLIGDPATVTAKTLAASEILGGVSRIMFQMSAAVAGHETMIRAIELRPSEGRR